MSMIVLKLNFRGTLKAKVLATLSDDLPAAKLLSEGKQNIKQVEKEKKL